MATIDSVEFYMGLSSVKSGFNIVATVYAPGPYSNDPDTGSEIGSKSQDVSVVPLLSGAGPDWVTFTFDTPLTVSANNFAGIVLDSEGSDFNSTPIRCYYAQDYSYYSSGAKDGTERFYRDSGGNWVDTGASIVLAYRVNGTDITQNVADNPSGSYYSLGQYDLGWRAYVDGLSAPGKASSPNPADSATGVTLDQATLTWTEGTGTVNYEKVYFGPTGSMVLQDSLDTDQSWALADTLPAVLPLPYNTEYQWRIDSVNDSGTTTGDTWTFTTMAFAPPSFESGDFQVIKRLCGCANNKFWYEDL